MKNHYFVKLICCRPTFIHDMTDAEPAIMGQHAAYWKTFLDRGDVVVFGPVMDPAGPYGMGVVAAEDEAAIRAFIAGDPAGQLNTYEFYPMRAVLPS